MNNISMFYVAKPKIFEKANELRLKMTESEVKLWFYLKKNKIMGFRFKAQHPIDKFIVDFYCHKLKLIIEVDGEIHEQSENIEYDIGRTAELEKYGLKVIRFTNQQILGNIKDVVQVIIKICNQRKSEVEV